ncbi:MAG: hypothetical protein UZ21_OP11001000915 [Microgenomates bacterium OLB22]|nr:MAG: hypothetical protein UZ21_OP11001000915 [Microgenomates bacterium OLB22]
MKKITRLLILSVIVFSNHQVPVVMADDMYSTLYRIEEPNVNIGGKDSSSSNYDLSKTVGQSAAGEYDSTGYIVKAGFQYIHSIIPFSFSISDTSIDLGTLAAQTPSTQDTVLTVAFGSAGTYQVTVEELGKLRTADDSSNIPDTTCNAGTCTETSAQVWTSTSAYGFGYTMAGNDIPTDFVNTTYYRPFPDRLLSETPAVVMSSTNVGKNRQATMTIKSNISTIQPAGNYRTVLQFIATPSF